MTYIPYLGTFFFSRYPSVALARNKYYYLAFFPYDGYYSETDRTGTVQKTIPSLKFEASIQRPPPTTMMYIPTRLWLHACVSRHFGGRAR